MSVEMERIQALTERQVEGTLRSRLAAKGNKKPRRSEVSAEFLVYKQELIAAENVRIAEVARIKALQDRIKVLKHGNAAASIIANQPNAALVFRKIIADNDEALLASIESKDAELEIEAGKQRDKGSAKKAAMQRLEALDLSGIEPVLKDIILVLKR